MADLIPFPRPTPKLNRHARRARHARGYDQAYLLDVLRELTEASMAMAEQMAERARQGDTKAALHFARYAEEVCDLIELDHDIRCGRPGRPSTLKTVKRRSPTRPA